MDKRQKDAEFRDRNCVEISDIMAYENGDLDDAEVIEMFQKLINTGLAWELQGSYGRTAMSLIKSCLCVNPDKEHLN
jgi:hypothetical protein